MGANWYRRGTSPEGFARVVSRLRPEVGFDAVPQDKLAAAQAQRVGVAMVRASVVAVVGAAGAVAVAIVLSPLTPVGLARLAEIHRGAEVNLAILGAGSAALVVVRRRQRDLAVLKTVGFLRRQVAAAVACHATAVALTGILVGVPLGAALGRSAWAPVVREAVGTEPAPVVPTAPVVVVVLGAVVVAIVLAAWPGWAAARIRPATALRVE